MTSARRAVEILLSPCCQTKIISQGDSIVCTTCSRKYPLIKNCIDFRDNLKEQHEESDNKKSALSKILSFANKIPQERVGNYYERLLEDKDFCRQILKNRFPLLRVGENKLSVLDVGCGKGRLSALFSTLGHYVAGIDIAPHSFWSRLPDADFILTAPANFPRFAEHSFDVCIQYFVLEYVKDPLEVLKSCKSALKEDGYLCVQVPNSANLYSALRRRPLRPGLKMFDRQEIEGLIKEAGFRICQCDAERFYAPVFPFEINALRHLFFKDYDPFFDRDSMLVKLTPQKLRGVLSVTARA